MAAVDLEEHGSEDDKDPDHAGGADGVGVDEAGEDDGHGLAEGHDDDEGHGAELGDGVVDEELAHGGAHGEDHAVEREHGVLKGDTWFFLFPFMKHKDSFPIDPYRFGTVSTCRIEERGQVI